MKFPAEADKCSGCEGIFVGLSGSTKWCPYCGAGHEGETAPMLERYENPKHTKKKEPETSDAERALDVDKQRFLLRAVVDTYSNNFPISFDLANQCAEQLGLAGLEERPQQVGKESSLAEEVAATVGERLKTTLFSGGGVFKIENLTVNIGK